MLKVILDLLWPFQQIHDLRYTSPRKALSGGNFRLGDSGIPLDFLAPQTGLVVRVHAVWFAIVLIARF